MRSSGCVILLVTLTLGSSTAMGQRKFPAPVHPDTLPTLIQSWSLPASLAPYVTNSYAPRLTRQGSVLFVYDHHGRRLAAVRAGSGKVEWHAPVRSASDQAFAFTPLIYKNRVYVASHGYLFAFDALNGRLKWEIPTKGIAVNGLARSKHRIFLPWIRTTGNKAQRGVTIWAMDSRRGRVEWSKKFPGKIGFLTGDTNGVYYAGDTGVVMGLTSDRGTPLWQVRLKGRILSPPILHKGKLYISTLRKKAGWKGTSIFHLDLKTGKIVWQHKIASDRVHKFLMGADLATVDGNGKLAQYEARTGKKLVELTLRFSDVPRSLLGTAVGKRVFVFSSHSDKNGYIWLVDMEKKRVLTAANSLDMNARTLLSAAKMLFVDGVDGNVYAYRLDRSARPKRLNVPPEEFAKEMLDRVKGAKRPILGLAPKLAGLGNKALGAVEPALASDNPFVVAVAAETIGFLGNRRSLKALSVALKRLSTLKADPRTGFDALLPVLHAMASLADGRSIKDLKKLLQDTTQSHLRRRAAYVALGAIGTPAALGPIRAYQAARQVSSTSWNPLPYTASYAFKVEADVGEFTAASWPEAIRKRTTHTIQTKGGKVYTASLSSYLGGYNDVWIGQSDLSGMIQKPIFTGLTKAELAPNRRIRIKKLQLSKDGKATLRIELKHKKKWIAARPVTISLSDLNQDRDGDRLPDHVERRMHLCVGNSDTDGDGLKDSEDLNPLASGKLKPTREQLLYREAFFTYFSFLTRRGIVVVDPGDGPSYELYGRKDPILSLRRRTVERLRKEIGLHAVDYVSFGGPYPEGGGSGDALPEVVWNKRKNVATIGMDILRSGENAVAYNVTLKKVGRDWVVSKFDRVWTTN